MKKKKETGKREARRMKAKEEENADETSARKRKANEGSR